MEEEFHFIADDDDPWVAKMGGTSFQSGHDLTNSTHKSGNVGKQTGPIHTRKQSAKRGLSLLYSAVHRGLRCGNNYLSTPCTIN